MQSHTAYSRDLFERESFTDCTVRCQNKIWHLHRAILSQRCSFFKACFSRQFKESSPNQPLGIAEVELLEDEPDTIGRILEWLYTLEYPLQAGVEVNCGLDISMRIDKSSSLTGSVSDSSPTSRSGMDAKAVPYPKVVRLPDTFWTSELLLLIAADKYGLEPLADQASTSILNAAFLCPTNSPHISSLHNCLCSIDNFTRMLEIIYTDISSNSVVIRNLRRGLLMESAMMIASHASQQSGLSDLITTIPDLAGDLIEALRNNIMESKSSGVAKNATNRRNCTPDSRSSSVSSWSSVEKPYIPMNEDSDTE